jgi:hypothetical protein
MPKKSTLPRTPLFLDKTTGALRDVFLFAPFIGLNGNSKNSPVLATDICREPDIPE